MIWQAIGDDHERSDIIVTLLWDVQVYHFYDRVS